MTERTLSQRERNRALLARQLLLEPADLPIPRTVERIGGLQAQYAPSACVGLWTPLKGFRRYLGGFGPSTTKEIAGWSGVPPTSLEGSLARMRLRRFRSEGGEVLHDLPRAPLPDGDTPAPIRFLPTWDATLLINERGTQILPEHHRPRVFNTKTPHSVPTFLVDGQVAGTWRFEAGRVRVEPFDRLPRTARVVLDDEAERLRAFHEDVG